MKYVKLYNKFLIEKASNKEFFQPKKEVLQTFQQWFDKEFKDKEFTIPANNTGSSKVSRYQLDIRGQNLIDLIGIEKFEGVKTFNCSDNKLTSLKGLENLKSLEKINATGNKLINLEGLENCSNLNQIECSDNELTSLKGIENLTNLEYLKLDDNKLTNLDELINLPNLKALYCRNNLFKYPLPKELMDKFFKMDLFCFYNNDLIEKFKTYDLQKEFLTKHPNRVKDLEIFGYHEKIKQEFPSLITGAEWGFFDLESI